MRIFTIVVAASLSKIVPRVKNYSIGVTMMLAFLPFNGSATLKDTWPVFTTIKKVNNDWNTYRVNKDQYTPHKKSCLVTSLRFTTTSSFLFCSFFRFSSYFFFLIMRKRLSSSDSSLWFGKDVFFSIVLVLIYSIFGSSPGVSYYSLETSGLYWVWGMYSC